MPDILEHEAEDAARHKYPEQVEVVELDIALAGFVAPEHLVVCGFAVDHVAQAALQLTLLAQRRVYGGGKRCQDDELADRSNQVESDALKHDIDEHFGSGDGNEHV